MMNSGWPNSTAWPFSHSMRLTMPEPSASISFMIFMASMMQIGCPSLIESPISTNGFAPGLGAR